MKKSFLIYIGLYAYEKVLDYTAHAKKDLLIIQWDGYTENIHQQWTHTPAGGDNFYIISPKKHTELALSYRKDGKVQLVRKNETDATQKLNIRKINKLMPKSVNVVGDENWEYSRFIASAEGTSVTRTLQLHCFAEVQKAFVRMNAPQGTTFTLNGQAVSMQDLASYQRADVTKLIRKNEANTLTFGDMNAQSAAVSEVEILMTNSERILWNTDATWTSAQGEMPSVVKEGAPPKTFAREEHLAIYELNAAVPARGEEETHMYARYKGDVANAYINGQLVADNFYDGGNWIISLSRQKYTIDANPMVIRIDGLESADAPIYFEKYIDSSLCVKPVLNEVKVKQEYRFIF